MNKSIYISKLLLKDYPEINKILIDDDNWIDIIMDVKSKNFESMILQVTQCYPTIISFWDLDTSPAVFNSYREITDKVYVKR